MPFKKSISLLGFAALGAFSLVGCEFGNKNTTELNGYDVISGYYETLPQTISFHAEIGSGAPRTRAGTVSQMPDFLKAVMGNPAMLFYDEPIEGVGSIRSHANTSLGFPTRIQDHAGTFGVSTRGSVVVSGCKFAEETIHTGRFSQNATSSTIAGLSVRGKISLDYSANYSLIGDDVDCDVMRATFKSCYSDNVGCSSDPESIYYRPYVTKVFGSLIGAGLITDAEIASARSVGYHATYQ